MWCLWNGEYGEHDVQDFSEKHLQYMDECHAKWVGHIVGDFTCIKVEYDWGKRDQRWTIKCNLCGAVSYRYHAKEWRRRTDARCGCRKADAKERKEQEEKAKKKRAEERKAKAEAKKIEKLKKEPVVSKYASNEWIGKRNGHLTAIGRDGSLFICRCDCGNELTVRPVELFTRKTKKVCGEPDCQYSSVVHRIRQAHKKEGIAYEQEAENMLIERGYNAKVTKGVGDFGVDIIITNEDGSLTAVQCKMQEAPAGVDAIQEVYAGGRFYDCTKFAVICKQGFSNPAIIMARKLGVYLCDGEFEMPENIDEYTATLLPVFHGNEGIQKLYDIGGTKHTLADWCAIYGKSQYQVKKMLGRGCTIEIALKAAEASSFQQFTVRGVTGNLTQICKYFDVLAPTVKYRMEHMGMTLEDAIFTPTKRAAE
jgi:hypothetical protein